MSNESTPFSTVAVAQKSRTWTSPLMGDAARARIAAREALLEKTFCTALYPRTPAPGDPNKKSFRMCPCFEPEMNDIEKLICEYAMDSGATAFYLKRNPPRFPGTPPTSGNLYMKYRNSRFLRRQPP